MKIFISALEVSADQYGSQLASALKALNPKITLVGIGGEKMRDAGVEVLLDLTKLSSVGIFEAFRFIPKLIQAYRKNKALLKQHKPDVYVVIDAQGFHMMMLKVAKLLKIKTVYFISPQEWQWGTVAGGKKVLQYTDHILAIFKKEADFYEKLGGQVSFVGHPILDHIQKPSDPYFRSNLKTEKPILALFPGSRLHEIRRLLPLLLESASQLKRLYPNFDYVLSISSPVFDEEFQKYQGYPITLYRGPAIDLIKNAYFSISASGTIILEHALCQTPCVAIYQFSPLTYAVAHTFFKKKLEKLPYMTLPNLLLNKPLIPELLQKNATVSNIVKTTQRFLDDPLSYSTYKEQLKQVHPLLGEAGAIQKAAQAILSDLQ